MKGSTCSTPEELAEAQRKAAWLWGRCEKKPSGCWEWPGSLVKGYGVATLLGRAVRAHRIALMLALGRPLTAEEQACHHCDNRKCVNPDHLFAGTNRDNVADMMAKGRVARGARQGLAVITEDAAREIIGSSLTQRALAKKFGVTQNAIHRIQNGSNWTHIPRPPASFVCKECGRDFQNRMGLAGHMRHVRKITAEGGADPHTPLNGKKRKPEAP